MPDATASIQSLELDQPPSCIEFCPAHGDLYLVGTYHLEKSNPEEQATGQPQVRHGSILVYRLEGETMRCLETVPQPSAILDLHFQTASSTDYDVVAVASSTATLSLFRLHPEPCSDDGSFLEPLSVLRLPDNGEEVLFLSCAWHPTQPNIIAVTTSRGAVYVMHLTGGYKGLVKHEAAEPVLLHDLEAWTVAFSPTLSLWPLQEDETEQQKLQIGTIYSGGDDSTLRYKACILDAAADSEATTAGVPDNTLKLPGHEAGVTAILPTTIATPDGREIVVTGSYDDHIRVFSVGRPAETYGMRQATCLADQNLGGGVWRLKKMRQTHADDGSTWRLTLLVSCMHAGARVVVIEGDGKGGGECRISVVTRFEEHESMNYGSDFQPGTSKFCVSTSFYDRRMCLWITDEESD